VNDSAALGRRREMTRNKKKTGSDVAGDRSKKKTGSDVTG
jgi:hypothetical protein